MAQLVDFEGVPIRCEESEQLADLGVIGADRVRAAVRFELKPAEIFVRGGLQGEWHVEAELMIMDR